MNFRQYTPDDSLAIESLFRSVFSQSEGEKEGELIGSLSKTLMSETAENDLFGFVALNNNQIVGSIFLSRLCFQNDNNIEAFLLAPVAVKSDFQRKGIGQGLINHGLHVLREKAVNIVLTYGDPKFYSKLGFQQISQERIRPPFMLSQPEGWLGQSLIDDEINKISDRCTCVKAWNNPLYW